MKDIPLIAGEVLEVGDIFYVKEKRGYKITDTRQIVRGVIPQHYDKGDEIEACIVKGVLVRGSIAADECIGTAGEDLVAGGYIELHADGQWYNKTKKD